MRGLFSFVFLAGILLLLPGAHGADPAGTLTGTWEGAFDYQGQSVPLTFHLTEAGGTVTGNVAGLPTTPSPIHDGKIEDGKLSFWASTDYQGETYKLVFTGQVSSAANEISFTLGAEDGSWSSALLARRSPSAGEAPEPAPAPGADVSGTWKGSFDFQGAAVPVSLHFTAAGESLSGTVEGMLEDAPQKPVEIHDGKVDGDTLSFWIDADYQGQNYRIVYKGTLADGKIKFSFGTDDGSWGSEMTVQKAGS